MDMSNKLALPIGVDDFEILCTKDYYYVDKTLLIKELLDLKGMINVFMRPRRFGKSLNLSMLKYFFEKTEKNHAELFKDKKIWSCGEKYTSEQGKYPVIHLSLKSTKTDTWDKMKNTFQTLLRNEFLRHSYLLDSDNLTDIDKEIFEMITNLKATFDETLYKTSIKNLSELLTKYYGTKPILLIDEYDVPLQTAHKYNFYDKAVNFVSGLFQESMKDTGQSLEFAVITGCLRISKESIFTGFNNTRIFSVLNVSYAEYFGFEDFEVEELFKYYQIEFKLDEAKKWYNGYRFGQTGIINPWSILNFISEVIVDKDKIPEAHWANTSGNDIVYDLIKNLDNSSLQTAKADLETLMSGGTIEKKLDVNVTYINLNDNTDNIWNMLFFTGYLTQVGFRQLDNEIYYDLKIPNIEVENIFKSIIKNWFDKVLVTRDFKKLYKAMMKQDCKIITDEINQVLKRSISYLDNKETFYHGLLIGIFSTLPGYILKSNRECGDGRSDIMLEPMDDDSPAIIIELKVANKRNQKKEKCLEALDQIEKMHYDREFIEDGIENILKYGIAFSKKNCLVMSQESK